MALNFFLETKGCSQRSYAMATNVLMVPVPSRTNIRIKDRRRSFPRPLAKVSSRTSVMSAFRRYRASIYHICLANAEANAERRSAGKPNLRGRDELGRSTAPSLRYGARRYRKTVVDGGVGNTAERRTSKMGLLKSSSSSSVKSSGLGLIVNQN
jgi:hypothetical protein